MRVAFDVRPVTDLGGVGRYSRCISEALRQTAAAGDELLDAGRPASGLRAKSVDVYHTPWIEGAMLHCPCPMVVTIHDLAALKRRSEHLRGGLRLRLRPLAVQRAARVIVPTAAVAEDALTHLRIDPRRLAVIAEAADRVMHPRTPAEVAIVRHRLALPEQYLLWVGSLQHPDPGAHVAELAAAPRGLPLVMVGPTRPWAHELPGVILTGRVSDDELAAIYCGARALLISSEQEGFGLPGVEALACGTPVVAAEGPALREALGERAAFVPPGDMAALVATAERAQRPAPAPPRWSWSDAARSTWAVYAEAIAERAPVRAAPIPLRRPAGGFETR